MELGVEPSILCRIKLYSEIQASPIYHRKPAAEVEVRKTLSEWRVKEMVYLTRLALENYPKGKRTFHLSLESMSIAMDKISSEGKLRECCVFIHKYDNDEPVVLHTNLPTRSCTLDISDCTVLKYRTSLSILTSPYFVLPPIC